MHSDHCNSSNSTHMSIKDIAKTILPSDLFIAVREVTYKVFPQSLIMGKNYRKLKEFLLVAEKWEYEKIRVWQLKKFIEIMRYAYTNVPGYHELYVNAGITPEDIRKYGDIDQVPTISKEVFSDNLDAFVSSIIPSWKRKYVTTSGSSGIPFGFYHTSLSQSVENAFMHSAWEKRGWKLGDPIAVMRGDYVGTREKFWKYDSYKNELHLSSYQLTDSLYGKYMQVLREHKVKHLHAYPSVAAILADMIIENGDVGKLKFNAIFLGSENIYDWQKQKLREAHPSSKLLGWYGHSEQAIFAPWCEQSESYHVSPFYGLTEVLDSQSMHIKKGEMGEFVGTSFWNFATPFIRYRTADLVQSAGFGCGFCEKPFLNIKNIIGRQQNLLVTKYGQSIPIPTTSMHDDTLKNINQFQFYQEVPGQVIFRFIPKGSFNIAEIELIHHGLMKKLGGNISLRMEIVEHISRGKNGKTSFVIQNIKTK